MPYKNREDKLTEVVCIDCGEQKFINLRAYRGKKPLRCLTCANKARRGINSHLWKGGRIQDARGYIKIRIYPNDFFFSMANTQGYVLEHRLVVAKHLNRCLLPWEIVHHKGKRYTDIRNKRDNLEDNLQLLPSQPYHTVDSLLKQSIARLEKRVTLLEAENIMLKLQLEEQTIV